MNRKELVAAVADKTGESKATVDSVLGALADVATEEVKGRRKLVIPGLVTLDVKHRDARQGRNPATGETITIAARWAVSASPVTALKNAANG